MLAKLADQYIYIYIYMYTSINTNLVYFVLWYFNTEFFLYFVCDSKGYIHVGMSK